MSMKKILGLVSVDKLMEYLKPHVTEVFSIVDMSGRSMGDDNVDSLVPPQHRADFSSHAFHLLFSILHGTTVVPPGAFEPNNPKALEM